MDEKTLKEILEGLEPPGDLFAQMARQKDAFAEGWLGVKRVGLTDLECEGWTGDLRTQEEAAPAMLWCSECHARVVVTWLSRDEGQGCRQHVGKRGIAMYNPETGMNEELWEQNRTRCPICGAVGVVHGADAMRNRTEQIVVTVPYVREGVLILVQWSAERWAKNAYREGWILETRTAPIRAWTLAGRTLCEWRKAVRGPYGSTLHTLPEWEPLKKCTDRLGAPYFYCRDMPDLEGTALENAKLWEWMRDTYEACRFAPLAYIRLYLKHPNVETLITSGLGKTLGEWIHDECERYGGYYGTGSWTSPRLEWIRWKEKRPSAMLGMDRAALRAFAVWKADGKTKKFWAVCGRPAGLSMQEAKETTTIIGTDDAKALLDAGESLKKVMHYLQKQKEHYFMLRDYWEMQKYMGVDVEADVLVKFPPHLRAAHDRAVSAVRYKKSKKKEEEFVRMSEKLKGLAWEHDGICIRAAQSPAELVQEGKVLHHCVGGYSRSHCEGKCIFFIRHARRPERSWFTLQVDVKKKVILQNHGYGNERSPAGKRLRIPPQVKAFVARWKAQVLDRWKMPPKAPGGAA